MKNFQFSLPTKLFFGEGAIKNIQEKHLLDGKRVMMTYGGGSIKKNGVYDAVKAVCTPVVEFGGIEPNPHYETCMKAVAVAKENNIDFILAVGGGSVVDGSKFICAAIDFTASDNPWDIFTKFCCAAKPDPKFMPRTHIKLGVVLTLPATGTEMNNGGVITNVGLKQKRAFGSPDCYPVFSIVDPKYTYSLPLKQVRNGLADAFVHVCEQYLGNFHQGRYQDRESEALLSTLIEVAPLNLVESDKLNYRDRADFVYCATRALDNYLNVGVTQCWGAHMVGHELTTFYGLDHGQTLAITLPAILKKLLPSRIPKLAQCGRRVFHLDGTDEEVAPKTIESIENFFESIGQKTRLSAYGFDKSHFEEIASTIGLPLAADGAIKTKEDVLDILNLGF